MRYGALFLFAFAACESHGSSVPGGLNGMCLSNSSCNRGLVCTDGICLAFDGGGDDKPPPGDPVVLIDAPPGGITCADDSIFEPNDTVETAFPTGVDTQAQSLTVGFLALCPQGDKDHFGVTISVSERDLEASVRWSDGPDMSVALLSAAGTALVVGTVVGPFEKRACAANLPVGNYIVRAEAAMPVNYELTIGTLSSCP